MNKKESVFISAVLYLSDVAYDAEKFTRNLLDCLNSYFDHYEVIIVDDCSTRHEKYLEEVLPSLADSTITVVHMSVKQGIETCLRAGLDVSIGDFVFEFDTLEMIFENDLLWNVYQEALKGNDVVSVEPKQNNLSRKIFYGLFNKFSNADYDVNASAFRLVSRRAINRVLELNVNSVFRQAVYASCGLKNSKIEYREFASSKKARGLSLAIDTFLLYTELGQNVCKISVLFEATLVATSIIGLIINGTGWLFMISVLGLITLILLDVVVLLNYARLTLRGQNTKYLISHIEKIQKG